MPSKATPVLRVYRLIRISDCRELECYRTRLSLISLMAICRPPLWPKILQLVGKTWEYVHSRPKAKMLVQSAKHACLVFLPMYLAYALLKKTTQLPPIMCWGCVHMSQHTCGRQRITFREPVFASCLAEARPVLLLFCLLSLGLASPQASRLCLPPHCRSAGLTDACHYIQLWVDSSTHIHVNKLARLVQCSLSHAAAPALMCNVLFYGSKFTQPLPG